MNVQACLNGARSPDEHDRLPVTPREIAEDAAAAVRAGATSVHVHPKTAIGEDTLEPGVVAEVVSALRAAVPFTPVGLTTGLWAAESAKDRLRAVSAWSQRPDFASVNFHEDGAESLAGLLLRMGISVEAGLSNVDAVARWRRWRGRAATHRALLEVTDQPLDGLDSAAKLIEALGGEGAQFRVLLHGLDATCWEVARLALDGSFETRIGLEDTLLMSDGGAAPDNATLVRAVCGPVAKGF